MTTATPVPSREATLPSDLFERLRAPEAPRPRVDPGLAGGLRAWLEDGVAEAAASRAPGRGVVVVRDVLGAETIAEGMARMVFRLAVTVGASPHPFDDALGALAVTGRGPELLEAVQRLSASRRARLREEVCACAAAIAAQWRCPPSGWLPRTGERLAVALGGGRVVLHGTADLVLGPPSAGTASVCVVRVRHTPADAAYGAAHDGADTRAMQLLALAETIRSGAPPFQVAVYHPTHGMPPGDEPPLGYLACEEVTDSFLAAGVEAVLDDLARP